MNKTFCVTCGGTISSNDNFCPGCGAKLTQSPAKNVGPAIGPAGVQINPNGQSSSQSPSIPSDPPQFGTHSPQSPMLYQMPNQIQYSSSSRPNFVPFSFLPKMLRIALILQYIMIILVFVGLSLLVFIVAAIFSSLSSEDLPPGIIIVIALILVLGFLVVYLTRQIQYRSAGARVLISTYHGLVVVGNLLSLLAIGSLDFFTLTFLGTSSFILYTLVFDRETSRFFNGYGPPYLSD